MGETRHEIFGIRQTTARSYVASDLADWLDKQKIEQAPVDQALSPLDQ